MVSRITENLLLIMFRLKPFDSFSPEGGWSEGLDAFRFMFKNKTIRGIVQVVLILLYPRRILDIYGGARAIRLCHTSIMYYQ